MPLVSVCICCYNAEKYLREALDSIVAQTFRDWEMVIVDDGSTDSTGAIVDEYLHAGVPVRYQRQSNQGFAQARNATLALARGRYVALLDNDDIALPGRLEAQVELASRHPEAGLYFANTEHFGDDGRVLGHMFDSFDPTTADLSAGQATNALLMNGCFIDTESVMFPRSVAVAISGFRGHFRHVADFDFFLRVGARYDLVADSQVLARWRVHAGQLSQTARETIYREHVALLSEWRASEAVSSAARHATSLRLATLHVRRALHLVERGQFGEAARCLWGAQRSGIRPIPAAREIARRLTVRRASRAL